MSYVLEHCCQKSPKSGDVDALDQSQLETFQADFADFDKNKDGLLNLPELHGLFEKQLAREMSEVELHATFTLLDVNEDGRISFSEYMKHMVGDSWKGYGSVAPTAAAAEGAGEPDQLEAAAVKIQKTFRGKSARKKVTKKKKRRKKLTKEERLAKQREKEELDAIEAEIIEAARLKRESQKQYIADVIDQSPALTGFIDRPSG